MREVHFVAVELIKSLNLKLEKSEHVQHPCFCKWDNWDKTYFIKPLSHSLNLIFIFCFHTSNQIAMVPRIYTQVDVSSHTVITAEVKLCKLDICFILHFLVWWNRKDVSWVSLVLPPGRWQELWSKEYCLLGLAQFPLSVGSFCWVLQARKEWMLSALPILSTQKLCLSGDTCRAVENTVLKMCVAVAYSCAFMCCLSMGSHSTWIRITSSGLEHLSH